MAEAAVDRAELDMQEAEAAVQGAELAALRNEAFIPAWTAAQQTLGAAQQTLGAAIQRLSALETVQAKTAVAEAFKSPFSRKANSGSGLCLQHQRGKDLTKAIAQAHGVLALPTLDNLKDFIETKHNGLVFPIDEVTYKALQSEDQVNLFQKAEGPDYCSTLCIYLYKIIKPPTSTKS